MSTVSDPPSSQALDSQARVRAALFGVVLNQDLFLEGLSRTTVGHSSLICSLGSPSAWGSSSAASR